MTSPTPPQTMPHAGGGPSLVRAVSRWQLVGLAINDVIGSGVYLLPAAAAAFLGTASTLAVVVAAVAVTLLVLCFAEAASYFDQPGGAYLYTREAFGDFVGFEVGWMTWLARIASIASLANGFALATAYVWPPVAAGLPKATLITATLGLLAWINIVGVRKGAGTAVAFTIVKLIPLLFFAGSTGRAYHISRCRRRPRSARRLCSCSSPTPASRIRRRQRASTAIRAAMCRSRC
jgi:basic amino acid/polyamine antiporter, APA family